MGYANSQVLWNTNRRTLSGATGCTTTTPEASLFHELVHAYEEQRGQLPTQGIPASCSDALTRKIENLATQVENRYRRAAGLCERQRYANDCGPLDDPFLGTLCGCCSYTTTDCKYRCFTSISWMRTSTGPNTPCPAGCGHSATTPSAGSCSVDSCYER